jgi:hypothetical protein
LTQDADAGIKAKAEEKLTQSEEGQIKIAKEGTTEEKLRICKLPSISGTAQLILAKDPDKAVRRALLDHQYLTAEALTKLAEWNDEELTRSCENCRHIWQTSSVIVCNFNGKEKYRNELAQSCCKRWEKLY